MQELQVDVARAAAWQLPTNWSSVGIEYLNHEIYGGLYSQLVFGESFEEPASAAASSARPPPPPPPHTPTVDGLLVRRGYLTAGMDLRVAEVTLPQAIAFCVATSTCCGFTFPDDQEAAGERPHRAARSAFQRGLGGRAARSAFERGLGSTQRILEVLGVGVSNPAGVVWDVDGYITQAPRRRPPAHTTCTSRCSARSRTRRAGWHTPNRSRSSLRRSRASSAARAAPTTPSCSTTYARLGPVGVSSASSASSGSSGSSVEGARDEARGTHAHDR